MKVLITLAVLTVTTPLYSTTCIVEEVSDDDTIAVRYTEKFVVINVVDR